MRINRSKRRRREKSKGSRKRPRRRVEATLRRMPRNLPQAKVAARKGMMLIKSSGRKRTFLRKKAKNEI